MQLVQKGSYDQPCIIAGILDAENKSFVHSNFLITFASATDSKNAAVAMRYVKEKLTPAWGVVPETYELIESLYLTALEKFDLHFSKHPYFLGGKPCIGDFGMMSPLFGHLGRDPKPAFFNANACRSTF